MRRGFHHGTNQRQRTSCLHHRESFLGSSTAPELFASFWPRHILPLGWRCLHQSRRCLRKKNEQIQLMQSIYQQANFTAAWLGPGTTKELQALPALIFISSQIKAAKNNKQFRRRLVVRRRSRTVSKGSRSRVTTVGTLFTNFSRTATGQERGHSKRQCCNCFFRLFLGTALLTSLSLI